METMISVNFKKKLREVALSDLKRIRHDLRALRKLYFVDKNISPNDYTMRRDLLWINARDIKHFVRGFEKNSPGVLTSMFHGEH